MHNWGVAFDLVFDGNNWKPGIQWSWDNKWPWKKLGELGKSKGLEWGGDWTTLRDWPHFQMTYGLHLDAFYEVYRKAKALADSQGVPIDSQGVLNTVWEMLG
jgi:peptidoglycan L-alanyl-D-glutamate endopeptidase CwlK